MNQKAVEKFVVLEVVIVDAMVDEVFKQHGAADKNCFAAGGRHRLRFALE